MGKHKIKHLSMLSIKSKIYPAICSKLSKTENLNKLREFH